MKKYMQLLLSVNFCLTAMGIANPTDSHDFVLLDNEDTLPISRQGSRANAEKVEKEAEREARINRSFHQIWGNLAEFNQIYPYQWLQDLLWQHQENITERPFQYNDEISDEILETELVSFDQSFFLKKIQALYVSAYQYAEQNKLENQLQEITSSFHMAEAILEEARSSSLFSKKEKALLIYQFKELEVFLIGTQNNLEIVDNEIPLTRNLDVEDSVLVSPEQVRLNEVRDLLDSCQEEDALIYAEREPIINSKEVETEDFLTSPRSKLFYINRNEGLMEINHRGQGEPYTTIWKMRQADVSLIKDWNEHDTITISKTGIFSKYSIYGEKLEYTLSNGKTSVRANLLCESTKQNTYTLLDIDYCGNAVILENGICLFGASDENFEGWYIKDQVVLRRLKASLNTKAFHTLINKTRNKKNKVSVRQQ